MVSIGQLRHNRLALPEPVGQVRDRVHLDRPRRIPVHVDRIILNHMQCGRDRGRLRVRKLYREGEWSLYP